METSTSIVHLGYLEKPTNKLWTKAIYFPSFVGGEPAFIWKEKFIPDMTVCQRWNSRLTFICQIYCPIESNPNAFHRMLYLYACLKDKWKESTEAIRVFRAQLPQVNPYFNRQPPNYSLLDLTDKQLESKQKDVLDCILQKELEFETAYAVQKESKKLSCVYMIEIDQEPESQTKKTLKKLKFLEKGEGDLEDYDSDDSQTLSSKDKELLEKYQEEEKNPADKAYAEELLKKYIQNEGLDEGDFEKAKELCGDDEDEGDDEELDEMVEEFEKIEKVDNDFEVFLDTTKNNSSQVIRYWQKGMLPLWCSNKKKLPRDEVPECPYCGSKRAYEMQLMPLLYNYINELVNLNWDSVMVYTWSDSWNPPEDLEYLEEFAYVELSDEQMKGNLNLSSPATVMEIKKPVKATKPVKEAQKNKNKDGTTKTGLDEDTEVKIKQQLDELQLEFD